MLKCCIKCGKEKETSAFYRSKNHRLGVYSTCKECCRNNDRIRGKLWKQNNPVKAYAAKKRCEQKRNERLFKLCLDHYGHVCNLCGAKENLCMDHIGGNKGNSPTRGKPLWRWIIQNNFPPGFRTLCDPCNLKDGCQRKRNKKEV